MPTRLRGPVATLRSWRPLRQKSCRHSVSILPSNRRHPTKVGCGPGRQTMWQHAKANISGAGCFIPYIRPVFSTCLTLLIPLPPPCRPKSSVRDIAYLHGALQLHTFATVWMSRLVDPTRSGRPVEPIPMEYAALPQYLVDDMASFLVFLARSALLHLSASVHITAAYIAASVPAKVLVYLLIPPPYLSLLPSHIRASISHATDLPTT